MRWGFAKINLRLFCRTHGYSCARETLVLLHPPFPKNAPLEPANARSIVMSSPFASCFVTKPHRWHCHRRHLGQTFAVPGRSRPSSQLRRVILGTSTRESRTRFRAGATDVSADELYTDFAWCEWCRTFICPDCVGIVAHLPAYDSSDGSELSVRGVAVAVPLPGHAKYTMRPEETERLLVVSVSLRHPWGTLNIPGAVRDCAYDRGVGSGRLERSMRLEGVTTLNRQSISNGANRPLGGTTVTACGGNNR